MAKMGLASMTTRHRGTSQVLNSSGYVVCALSERCVCLVLSLLVLVAAFCVPCLNSYLSAFEALTRSLSEVNYTALRSSIIFINFSASQCTFAVDKDGNKIKTIKGTSSWDYSLYCESPLRISPRRGLAVVHFPSLIPELGGTVDGNVLHQSEPAVQHLLLSKHPGRRNCTTLSCTRLSQIKAYFIIEIG